MPPGGAYETVIIYPPTATPGEEPAAGQLAAGVFFSRTVCERTGAVFDRFSVTELHRPSEAAIRALRSYNDIAPEANVVSTRPEDVAQRVDLSAPEYVWTYGARGAASIRRFASNEAAAAARDTTAREVAADKTHGAAAPSEVDWADIKHGDHPSFGLLPPAARSGLLAAAPEFVGAVASRALQINPFPHPLGSANWCSGCPMYVSVRSTTPQYSYVETLFTAQVAFIPVRREDASGAR